MEIARRDDLVFSAGVRSRKYLITARADHAAVECAFLFRGERTSLCASCQAGCAIGCRHCATTYASTPFLRNLSCPDIVAMVRLVVDDANEGRRLDYLDFSGVGECSANWEAVRRACLECKISGLAANYRVTSIAPRNWCLRVMRDLQEGRFAPDRIVISLHGPNRDTRRFLVPRAEDPWKAASWWRAMQGRDHVIDLNYVLHEDNTNEKHLDELARFVCTNADWIHELRLSTMNPVPGMPLQTPAGVSEIAGALRRRIPIAITVNAFTSIGGAISMACGQLRASIQPPPGPNPERSIITATSVRG